MALTVDDAERAYYLEVLRNPDAHSMQDLRFAYYLAALDGSLAPSWVSGSNPYDAGLLAVVKKGDLFTYDNTGTNPGWTYEWDGTDWVYIIDIGFIPPLGAPGTKLTVNAAGTGTEWV